MHSPLPAGRRGTGFFGDPRRAGRRSRRRDARRASPARSRGAIATTSTRSTTAACATPIATSAGSSITSPPRVGSRPWCRGHRRPRRAAPRAARALRARRALARRPRPRALHPARAGPASRPGGRTRSASWSTWSPRSSASSGSQPRPAVGRTGSGLVAVVGGAAPAKPTPSCPRASAARSGRRSCRRPRWCSPSRRAGADEIAGELYDLRTDPQEMQNLWAARPEVAVELLTGFRARMAAPYRRYRAAVAPGPPRVRSPSRAGASTSIRRSPDSRTDRAFATSWRRCRHRDGYAPPT